MSAFISSLAYEPGFPVEWEGLDYESAKNAIPRWYGVSFGNGNDGVSHMYTDYYVRTCEPFRLAELAMLGEFKPGEGQAWAQEVMELGGEADYGISATILNPPDDGENRDHSQCEDGEDCEGCEMCDLDSLWSDVNGAWMICEVFPVDESDMRDARQYDSLQEAFTADLLALVEQD